MTALKKYWDQKGKQPIVLVHTANEDPTRGDIRAFEGIGKILADKLGFELVIINHDMFYSDDTTYTKAKHAERLTELLQDYGPAKIVLGRYITEPEKSRLYKNGTIMIETEINEHLSGTMYDNKSLVAHHITVARLQEEGQKLREHYPHLKKPLIAVMTTSHREFDINHLPTALLRATAKEDEASIFLCSSKRTTDRHFRAAISQIRHTFDTLSRPGRITVDGYNLAAQRDGMYHDVKGYNPYIGLLDQADHIIVPDNSASLASEPFAAGKTIHFADEYATDTENKLLDKGLARMFNKSQECAVLQTRAIEPINITETIANKLLWEYRLRTALSAPRRLYHKIRGTTPIFD
ncbi:MAG: mitochondrial fission ELM1 family protein [Rhodospirillales bacterium]|nr:mitochondrial fission ELM1 family protein [Rhodospirillales bacterium]MCB9995059.1 mitochondrial fission ELM1 family protein [Rhodospirillales bacterium]